MIYKMRASYFPAAPRARTTCLRVSAGLMTASISPDTEPALVDDASSFLNYALRADDLMLELNEHHWLLAIAVSEMEVPRFMDRIAEAREKANRNRPFGPIPEIEIQCFAAFPSYEEQEILDAADNCIQQIGASLATVDG